MMGRWLSRAGSRAALSRVASSFWLLAALLVLHWGTPFVDPSELRLGGTAGSLTAELPPVERANPRSTEPSERARSVLAEAHYQSLKPGPSTGADHDASLIASVTSRPDATATPLPAPKHFVLPPIPTRAFDARAPPGQA